MDLWERMSQNGELLGTIGLTVLGIVMYILLRFSYFVFYNSFGVSPEEVGLGYIDILVRSGPTLIGAILISAGLSASISRLLVLQRRERHRNVLLGVAAILLVMLCGGPARANRLASVVENGTPVRPLTIGKPLGIQVELLGIQVDYVSVVPVNSGPAGNGRAEPVGQAPQPPSQQGITEEETPTDLSQRTALLYFGQANGIAVLYDHDRQQVIRVPMTEVTMFAG